MPNQGEFEVVAVQHVELTKAVNSDDCTAPTVVVEKKDSQPVDFQVVSFILCFP